MTSATVSCPKCLTPLAPPPGSIGGSVDSVCPTCGANLILETFPRLAASQPTSSEAGSHALDGEAVCQFYPELQAETVCEECGCFMSQKAAVTWGGRTLCMPCLHQLRENKGEDAFSAKRSLHDNAALGMVVLLFPLSLLTGPIAAFYLIRNRKSPGSLVPRSALRWWLALSLSIAVTAGWIFLFIVWIATIVRAFTS